jgi:hypothetical protein
MTSSCTSHPSLLDARVEVWGNEHEQQQQYSRVGLRRLRKDAFILPAEASMDRIVISKPGDMIPTSGEELFESVESVKRRRKMGAGSVLWNTLRLDAFALSHVTGVQPCKTTNAQTKSLKIYRNTCRIVHLSTNVYVFVYKWSYWWTLDDNGGHWWTLVDIGGQARTCVDMRGHVVGNITYGLVERVIKNKGITKSACFYCITSCLLLHSFNQ